MPAVTADTFVTPTTDPAAHRRWSPSGRLSPRFEEMYAKRGTGPRIPPEHLLKGSLLIALFSVRSERQFCEQLRYNLLFKWFLDLNVDDEPFNATTFSKNRERLLEAEVARAFFAEVVGEAGRRRLLSDEHFSVDGTLLEAWASLKSYRPRDEQEPPSTSGPGGRNAEVDFRGQRRSRETHVSRTDAEARLYRKGPQQEAKLSYLGHVLSENRHGLVVDVELSEANGYGEREAALQMLERSVRGRATLGADRGYDTRDFVAAVRARGVTPHVARNDRGRRSAIDGRTTRHPGVRTQLAAAEAGGGGLRLAEDRGRRAQAALPGTAAEPRLVGANRSGVQPRAHLAAGARRGVGGVRPPARPAPAEASGRAGRGNPKRQKPSAGTRGQRLPAPSATPEAHSSAPC